MNPFQAPSFAVIVVAVAGVCVAAPPRQTAYEAALVRVNNQLGQARTIAVETDYLPHVVRAENGAAGIEALKAQAVAARSFRYYNLNDHGYIGDGENDQVYTGNGGTPNANHVAAAASTEREILRFGNGVNDVTIAAFFVAGTRPSIAGTAPFGVAEAGDSPSSSTESFVTYNRGLAGNNIRQTSLGFTTTPPSSFPLNRGAQSQNGASFLSDNGWNYLDILRFYYGQDIHVEVAKTPANGARLANVKSVANFDVDQGSFGSGIASSRNENVASATLNRVTAGTHAGAGAQQIVVTPTTGARFDYFDLSGLGPNSTRKLDGTVGDANALVATATTNLSMESIGSVGFWLKATAPAGADLTASLLVDDDGDGTEAGRAMSIVADGIYRKYEWFLASTTDWASFAGGDGVVDGAYFSIDSIRLRGLAGATVTIDDVFYDARAVAPVPEPTTLAIVALAGLAVPRRRRA